MPPSNALRAVAIVRMSDDRQVNSPERQREAFSAYCERHNLTPCGEYADLAVSATHTRMLDRPGIQRLLADAPAATWTVVWAEEVSRAARKGEEILDLDQRLWGFHKVLVGPADDPRAAVDRHMRKLLLFLRGWQAEGETLKQGDRIRDTLRMKVRQGLYRGGNLSLGFRWAEGQWHVDEEGAALATQIYRQYLERRNLEQIAAELNAAGQLTCKGNPWSGSSVRAILRGPMYRGLLRFGGEDYPCESLPEVVPAALVAQVDDVLSNLQRRPQRADHSESALFTGLLRCPVCDHWMNLQVAYTHKRGKSYPYRCYYCWRGRVQPRSCPHRRCIGQRAMEKALLPLLAAHLQELADELPAATRAPTAARRERTVQRLQEERQRALQLHVSGRISEAELDGLLAQVEARLQAAEAETPPPAPSLTRREVRQLAREVDRHWATWSIPHRRRLLQELVEYIVPDADDLANSTVVWRLT